MNVLFQFTIILSVCMVGEGIASILPMTFPASVISLILLIVLLLTGVVKERHISRCADFITGHMSFFFVPSCIGIMQYFDLIIPQIVPFLLVTALTTPLIYAVTAWTVQLMVGRMEKEAAKDD